MPIGPSPFSGDYEAFKAQYKKATKKQKRSSWVPTQGWRGSTAPKMRELTESTMGKKYKVPDNEYDEFMKFVATQSQMSAEYAANPTAKRASTPADYIDWAFEKSSTKNRIVTIAGVGHIKQLTYHPAYQLLKVLFANDSECVFFRVPSELASTLIVFANSGATRVGADGKEHHILGIYFWDLIRIRGTIHGTRYAFEYTQNNNSGGESGRPQENVYEERDFIHKPWELVKDPMTGKKVQKRLKLHFEDDPARLGAYEDAKKYLREGDYESLNRLMQDWGLPSEQKFVSVKKSDASEDTLDALNANVKAAKDYEDTPLGNASSREFDKIKHLMDNAARNFNATNKKQYEKLGKVQPGETEVDAALRQEKYLIKYGLWGDYMDMEDLSDEYGE